LFKRQNLLSCWILYAFKVFMKKLNEKMNSLLWIKYKLKHYMINSPCKKVHVQENIICFHSPDTNARSHWINGYQAPQTCTATYLLINEKKLGGYKMHCMRWTFWKRGWCMVTSIKVIASSGLNKCSGYILWRYVNYKA
jgi:hypothetical protein